MGAIYNLFHFSHFHGWMLVSHFNILSDNSEIFFCNVLIQVLCPFFYWVVYFLHWLAGVPSISYVWIFDRFTYGKYFLPPCGLHSHFCSTCKFTTSLGFASLILELDSEDDISLWPAGWWYALSVEDSGGSLQGWKRKGCFFLLLFYLCTEWQMERCTGGPGCVWHRGGLFLQIGGESSSHPLCHCIADRMFLGWPCPLLREVNLRLAGSPSEFFFSKTDL